jgi:hypothetical protein
MLATCSEDQDMVKALTALGGMPMMIDEVRGFQSLGVFFGMKPTLKSDNVIHTSNKETFYCSLEC